MVKHFREIAMTTALNAIYWIGLIINLTYNFVRFKITSISRGAITLPFFCADLRKIFHVILKNKSLRCDTKALHPTDSPGL
jgi:hypothetical protein